MGVQKQLVGLSALAIVAACAVNPADAIVRYGDAAQNTAAPAGDCGWQYQGLFGNYLGTPIAPQFFVTSKRASVAVGQPISYQGTSYTTTAYFDDAASDLRVWQISGNFPNYAPLYSGNAEAGKSVVIFGRGIPRGSTLQVSGEAKGWYLDYAKAASATPSWGTNTITAVLPNTMGGKALQFNFDADQGADEGYLAKYDEGGGVFIQDSGVWKLVGVNWTSDQYTLTIPGTAFYAAVYDQRGLNASTLSTPALTGVSGTTIKPGASYATRLADSTFIQTFVVPEPGTATLVLGVWGLLALRRKRS